MLRGWSKLCGTDKLTKARAMEQKIGMFGTNQTWRRGVKTPTKHEQMCTKIAQTTRHLRNQAGSWEAEGSWWPSRDRRERGAETYPHLEEEVPGDTDTVDLMEADMVTRQGLQLEEAPGSNTETLRWGDPRDPRSTNRIKGRRRQRKCGTQRGPRPGPGGRY